MPFVFKCLFERDVGRIVEHALRLRKRNGWACGKALGPVGNERINIGVGHYAIDKTNALGFLRANDLGKQRQLFCSMHANAAWKHPAAAKI